MIGFKSNLVPRALFPGFGKPGKSALGTRLDLKQSFERKGLKK